MQMHTGEISAEPITWYEGSVSRTRCSCTAVSCCWQGCSTGLHPAGNGVLNSLLWNSQRSFAHACCRLTGGGLRLGCNLCWCAYLHALSRTHCLPTHPPVPDPHIEGALQQLLVVSARVNHDWQAHSWVDAASRSVQRQLAAGATGHMCSMWSMAIS